VFRASAGARPRGAEETAGTAADRRSRPAARAGIEITERLILDAPVLTSLGQGEREKRRAVALSVIPDRMRQAVLAIEDRRFFEHPGVDPIGIVGAVISNIRGKRGYTAGGSTITQQVRATCFFPRCFRR
jgi:membrane peptidoglycan carboxypeptidase